MMLGIASDGMLAMRWPAKPPPADRRAPRRSIYQATPPRELFSLCDNAALYR